MERRRTIAAAPHRSSTAAWQTITDLVVNTLGVSSSISTDDVRLALSIAAEVGRPLIAGAYLDRAPVVVVAPPLHLSITTVSGDAALGEVDRETETAAGAATAKEWTIYLPTPEPLAALVRTTANKHAHLSAEPPPESAEKAAATTEGIDREALRRLGS